MFKRHILLFFLLNLISLFHEEPLDEDKITYFSSKHYLEVEAWVFDDFLSFHNLK